MVTEIPEEYLIHLKFKGKTTPFIRYRGLLALAHARGIKSLVAKFISVTPDMALAEAHLVLSDGSEFSEVADATPSNVNPMIRPHFPRMAATRAKARAIRDALDIGIASVEELAELTDEYDSESPPQKPTTKENNGNVQKAWEEVEESIPKANFDPEEEFLSLVDKLTNLGLGQLTDSYFKYLSDKYSRGSSIITRSDELKPSQFNEQHGLLDMCLKKPEKVEKLKEILQSKSKKEDA
jgi:hypothetical protein